MHSDFFFLRWRKNPRVSGFQKDPFPLLHHQITKLVFPLLCEYQVLRAAMPHSNTGASHFHAKQEESCILFKTEIILGEKDAKIP